MQAHNDGKKDATPEDAKLEELKKEADAKKPDAEKQPLADNKDNKKAEAKTPEAEKQTPDKDNKKADAKKSDAEIKTPFVSKYDKEKPETKKSDSEKEKTEEKPKNIPAPNVDDQLNAFKTSMQTLVKRAARFGDNDEEMREQYVSYNKLTYKDSNLETNIAALQEKLAAELKDKPEINTIFTALQQNMHLHHAKLLRGELDKNEIAELFTQAKNDLIKLGAKDTSISELDKLVKDGLSKHIKEQTDIANRQAFSAGSAAYASLINAHRKTPLWKREGEQNPALGHGKAGEGIEHYRLGQLKTGLYTRMGYDTALDIQVDDNKISARIIVGQRSPTEKDFREIFGILSANNAALATISLHPEHFNMDVLKDILKAANERLLDGTLKYPIPIALDEPTLKNLAAHDPQGKIKKLITDHNQRVAAYEATHEQREKKLAKDLKGLSPEEIVHNENARRIKNCSKDLNSLSQSPTTMALNVTQLKQDTSAIEKLEKAAKEIEKQQLALVSSESKSTSHSNEMKQQAKDIVELHKQLQATLHIVHERLKNYKDPVDAKDILVKADALKKKIDEYKTRKDFVTTMDFKFTDYTPPPKPLAGMEVVDAKKDIEPKGKLPGLGK